MDGDVVPGFLYLNLEDRWPEFRLDGLAVEDGRLVLAPLAAAPEALGPAVAGDAGTAWPADGSCSRPAAPASSPSAMCGAAP